MPPTDAALAYEIARLIACVVAVMIGYMVIRLAVRHGVQDALRSRQSPTVRKGASTSREWPGVTE